jgi:hypothetical protein
VVSSIGRLPQIRFRRGFFGLAPGPVVGYLSVTAQLVLTAGITSISLSSSPASVSVAGGTATISAKVSDGVGNPVAGIPVRFSADRGSLSADAATTDKTGTARVFLTTNTAAEVIATVTGAATAGAPARELSARATVTVSPLPAVSISASIFTNTSVTFTIRAIPAAGHAIVSLLVDYGDGRVESLAPTTTSVSHVYSAAGNYRATVTATDNLGGSGSAGIEIGAA